MPRQQEGVSSGATAGYAQDMDIMLYPNALITVSPQELPEDFEIGKMHPSFTFTAYTKHYYIGSERINSKLGTVNNLGLLCEEMRGSTELINEMNDRANGANKWLEKLYQYLDKELEIEAPYLYSTNHSLSCGFKSHNPKMYDAYWYHPDHLGSSSFITNTTGEISQHLEYLPFGETLVEEHLNSYNSPFKFNAKEFDAETGNYYYGARYMNPKWSMWLGVDPLYEMYPGITPYAYTLNNPINYIDPDGRSVGVRNGEDGTFEVVSGNVHDNDRGIYLVDDDGNYDVKSSERIAKSITTHSFFDANEEVVKGAIIDMNSNEGQEFLDQLIQDNPSLLGYMWKARNGRKYDFKDADIKERGNLTKDQYRYRGSVNSNGEVGSARDYGNIGAGMVAARKGLSWNQTRAGFDTYQGFSSNGISLLPTPGSIRGAGGIPMPIVLPEREATTSVKAQMVGYLKGLQRHKK